MAQDITGRCGCGAVRYRLLSAPMFIHCCHCLDCQRQTGGAFVINGLIETDRIELLAGTLEACALPTESGRPHDAYRCTRCQTALWSDYGGRAYLRFVRLTTLDDPAAVAAPDVHIYTRSKRPWVRLPDEARVFEAYYDMPAEWPAESLRRRQAASDADKAASAAG